MLIRLERPFQVKINSPLLDAIKHMLPYAKFLKELCNTKRITNVAKKAFLDLNVSSIISCLIQAKYKDPIALSFPYS